MGSPALDSRIISRSFNDLLYLIKRDEEEDFQHGFKPNKGIHTITLEL